MRRVFFFYGDIYFVTNLSIMRSFLTRIICTEWKELKIRRTANFAHCVVIVPRWIIIKSRNSPGGSTLICSKITCQLTHHGSRKIKTTRKLFVEIFPTPSSIIVSLSTRLSQSFPARIFPSRNVALQENSKCFLRTTAAKQSNINYMCINNNYTQQFVCDTVLRSNVVKIPS